MSHLRHTSQKCSAPAEHFARRARSVDDANRRCEGIGHPLPIDELKGTKPVESIDLSGKKEIGVASVIIIAACIKENAVLKALKGAARPCVHNIVNSL